MRLLPANDHGNSHVPESVARCETFLMDLMHSIEGNIDTNAENVGQSLSKYSTLQKLYGSLQSQNIPVECRICGRDGVERSARAFISSPLRIVLCANRLSAKDYAEAFTHEATHAFDYVFGSCDFSKCDGLAYSEVRAARNAECASSRFLFKNYCIKKSATKATANLFPQEASDCVARAFEKAVRDYKP